jgi:hypothetical protein
MPDAIVYQATPSPNRSAAPRESGIRHHVTQPSKRFGRGGGKETFMSSTTSTTRQARFWWQASLMEIKARADDTGGALGALEGTFYEQGYGPPLHVHTREDEVMYGVPAGESAEPPRQEEYDMEAAVALARKFGFEVVGPQVGKDSSQGS